MWNACGTKRKLEDAPHAHLLLGEKGIETSAPFDRPSATLRQAGSHTDIDSLKQTDIQTDRPSHIEECAIDACSSNDGESESETFTSMQTADGQDYLVSEDDVVFVEELAADGISSLREVGHWDEAKGEIHLFDECKGEGRRLDVGSGELEGALTPRPFPTGPLLTDSQIHALRDEGMTVVDNFLSKEEVGAARAEILQLKHHFEPSANTRLGVRKDLVGWVPTRPDPTTEHVADAVVIRPHGALLHAMRHLEAIIFDLNSSTSSGFKDLLLPCQAMIGSYEEGGFFLAHKDNEAVEVQEGDMWANPREVTAVLYLNEGEGWPLENGGQLKCFLDGSVSGRVLDVQPHGGRLVLFKSRELLHEVTKINSKPGLTCLPRVALTIWAVKDLNQK
jgi:hypothetical protein